ncbi:SDR family NAD(P)-dependent oxidoreductase [Pseudomonadota bacterium]|jgi:NAD(P)-dependent dehydrogenase (short-subunit alcohol dehydrogenase family)|nr:SDR family NAD(P)-dependent oxidoreductase [Alphaproteobacteria bacterium]MDC1357305.1 SDR family NAD(P)-dependent oxidoreductase [Pseudomonadota bacterium]|tara:strand:- start:4855 stop:5574 length:720 start_codon:yes stop_codon:yes gene_type:complete
MKKALVIGVGPLNGLGAQLCKKIANNNFEVFVAGRTKASLDMVVDSILKDGNKANPIVVDTTDELQIKSMIKVVGTGLDFAVYNVGNNRPGKIIDMDASYFTESWQTGCFGGFLFAKEVIKTFLKEKTAGTLIFTGASASLRGKPNFGAFNSAKGALRNLAQAIAKEYAENSIHVSHVIVDGGLAGERIKQKISDFSQRVEEGRLINIESVTEAYMFLYNQNKNAWTFELDVRTSKENW